VVAVIVVSFPAPFAASAFGPEVLDITETGETERQMHTTQLQEERFASDTKMVKSLPNGISYSLLNTDTWTIERTDCFSTSTAYPTLLLLPCSSSVNVGIANQ
jgi:hypothetical protein